jgi:hypothetical protein
MRSCDGSMVGDERRWVPAFAGTTMREVAVPALARNLAHRPAVVPEARAGGGSAFGDERRWVPAFAGTTMFGDAVPALRNRPREGADPVSLCWPLANHPVRMTTVSTSRDSSHALIKFSGAP